MPKYTDDLIPGENQVGVVNGLAWTSVGGTMLPIEVSAFPGTGKVQITGNLGDVMTESVKTAVGFIRSRADTYGIDDQFYKNKDLHIHAPEAAIPKDGPSAGLAITTALVSELTGIPIRCDVAMTGEISLKGAGAAHRWIERKEYGRLQGRLLHGDHSGGEQQGLAGDRRRSESGRALCAGRHL